MKFMKVVSVAILIMLLSVVFTGCAIKMPIPSVEHAEFNFSITYEKDGVIKTYNGVYVCEFEGVHKSFYGESRDWKGYVKDVPDGEYSTIAIETVDEGTIYVDLGFFPEYFMSDPDYAEQEAPTPKLYIMLHSDDPDVSSTEHEDDVDFLEKYGIRIVSFEYPGPIENEYEEKVKFGSFDIGIN